MRKLQRYSRTDQRAYRLLLTSLLSLLSGATLTACSVDGQITDATQTTQTSTMAAMSGIISGSYQNITTPGGYVVSASIGSPYSEPAANTTSGGYTVYSSVQGNINSETWNIIRR